MCSLLQFVLIMLNLASYHLDLLYIDEAHPAACAMLETGVISIRKTNKPFFRSPVDWNLEQILSSQTKGDIIIL